MSSLIISAPVVYLSCPVIEKANFLFSIEASLVFHLANVAKDISTILFSLTIQVTANLRLQPPTWIRIFKAHRVAT